MKSYNFTAQIERDRETGMYIGIVSNLPGAHTHAKSLDELNIKLKEVIELCLEEMSDEDIQMLPEFIGVQNMQVRV